MRALRLLLPFTLGALALGALISCGSSNRASSAVTDTVTVTAPATTTPSTSTASTTPTTPATTTTTRTQTAPAFTGGTPAGTSDLSNALSTIRDRGFTALSSASYIPANTLRVLIAARTGSADNHTQQAFFFDQGRYLGTDSTQPSAEIEVISQSDTSVTLGYRIYRATDALCCSTAPTQSVTFQLDMGRLQAMQPIPPVSARR